jgi:predicted DCC family thiol-disulfide oxidoreductase YuxK
MTAIPKGKSVLLFDGVCNLCNSSVQFVLKRDLRERFLFASLQSEAGQELMKAHGLDPASLNTVVLIDQDKAYTRSSAGLQVCKYLGFPWSLMGVFWIVPAALRNWVYNWIARNRYRWFGKQEYCMMPTPEYKARFLG